MEEEKILNYKEPKKATGTGVAVFLFFLVLIALAGVVFSVYGVITLKDDTYAKIDELKTELEATKKNSEEAAEKSKELEEALKEIQENKNTEPNEINQNELIVFMDNMKSKVEVLTENYKNNSSEFMNGNMLDKDKFEEKFFEEEDVKKSEEIGNWELKTRGSTLIYEFKYNEDAKKDYNFTIYQDLASYKVDVIQGDFNNSTFNINSNYDSNNTNQIPQENINNNQDQNNSVNIPQFNN